MTHGLRAQESTLADLLSPGMELIMPDFQRSYSWETKEAGDLFQDLLEASSKQQSHFIGAIVLAEDKKGRTLIVDGQQRLSTLTILMSILRDCQSDAQDQNTLQQMIADDQSIATQPIQWRMSLGHVDSDYFRASIQARGATLKTDIEPSESESQKRLHSNKAFLIKRIRDLSPEKCKQLSETLRSRVLLVKVMVESWDGGYNVFRVLNTRGKTPNHHDIIKTNLLEDTSLSAQDVNAFSRAWAEHEARLGGSGFDELLSQIMSLHHRKKKDPAEFSKVVLGRASDSTKRFLTDELPAYVESYLVLSTGRWPTGATETASAALNHIRLIDHQLWRAPALRFLTTHSDPSLITQVLVNLERFAYAAMLVITDQKSRTKRYQRFAELSQDPRQLLGTNSPLALSRDERRKISERMLGRFGSFAQRRAIALRLNAALEGGRPLGPEDGATVEHVLPRSLDEGSNWLVTWSNSETHRELVDTIGNFGLLTQETNQKADNLSFEDKKKLYFASGKSEFALTSDISEQVAWTPDTVRRRTRQLAEIMDTAWQLDRAILD